MSAFIDFVKPQRANEDSESSNGIRFFSNFLLDVDNDHNTFDLLVVLYLYLDDVATSDPEFDVSEPENLSHEDESDVSVSKNKFADSQSTQVNQSSRSLLTEVERFGVSIVTNNTVCLNCVIFF